MMGITSAIDHAALKRKGRSLEYFTIGWNSLEGLIAIFAGAIAGSISLVGFGIDSLVEVTSGAALLWRMSSPTEDESRERLSLQIVGACFLALAIYIAYEAIASLVHRTAPERSVIGIVLACVSLVVMPLLSRAKHKIATGLNSSAMHADAKQTEFCTYLSAILLAGLLLNAFLGWWWADPAAALVMVPIIAREGVEGLQGKACADCR
jgi:divalent metal cation (Fe/Co/Zn/Cd) transporter